MDAPSIKTSRDDGTFISFFLFFRGETSTSSSLLLVVAEEEDGRRDTPLLFRDRLILRASPEVLFNNFSCCLKASDTPTSGMMEV